MIFEIESPFLILVQFGCRWDGKPELIGQDGRKSPNFVERMDRLDEFFAKKTCLLRRQVRGSSPGRGAFRQCNLPLAIVLKANFVIYFDSKDLKSRGLEKPTALHCSYLRGSHRGSLSKHGNAWSYWKMVIRLLCRGITTGRTPKAHSETAGESLVKPDKFKSVVTK